MSDASLIYKLYTESARESYLVTDEQGNKRWTLDGDWHGTLHREDGPAVETANGAKQWFIHGKRHRIGAPALIYGDGSEEWYEDGTPHRVGGPAMMHSNGNKLWAYRGDLHRLDGAAIEKANGNKSWWVKGIRYDDVEEWAKAALKYERKEPTQDAIDARVAQVMQADLFD